MNGWMNVWACRLTTPSCSPSFCTPNTQVERVNESIKVDDASKIRSSINCLDIFGFECFKVHLCPSFMYPDSS